MYTKTCKTSVHVRKKSILSALSKQHQMWRECKYYEYLNSFLVQTTQCKVKGISTHQLKPLFVWGRLQCASNLLSEQKFCNKTNSSTKKKSRQRKEKLPLIFPIQILFQLIILPFLFFSSCPALSKYSRNCTIDLHYLSLGILFGVLLYYCKAMYLTKVKQCRKKTNITLILNT